MSNKTRLQANNTVIDNNNADLQAIIDTVNALPDAGEGGGGIVPVIAALNVTENGTYNAPVGIDGFAPVNVNVNEGVELPELDNPGSEADLMAGKQLIDADGNPVTGTFTVEEEVNTLAEKLAELNTILDEKAAGGGCEIETCTLTVTSNSICVRELHYIAYHDGRISLISREGATYMVCENVVKNSIISVVGAFTSHSLNDGLDRIYANMNIVVCSVSGENAELIVSGSGGS